MNWVKRIKKLLGWFWSNAFSNFDFIRAVVDSWAVVAKVSQAKIEAAENGLINTDKGFYATELPSVIYLRKRKLVISDGTGTFQDCIRHVPVSFSSVLNGTARLGDVQEDSMFVGELRESTAKLLFITDHVVTYSKTLFYAFDFIIRGRNIYLKMDPETLGLEQTSHIEADGTMSIDYILYGWPYPRMAEKHPVSTFEIDGLNEYADIIWDMHQNGATEMSVKRLLCVAADNAVCEESGQLGRIWTEQGRTCVIVGERVYTSNSPETACNFSEGAYVNKGDVLFDTVSVTTGRDINGVHDCRYVDVRVARDAIDKSVYRKCIKCIENNTDKSVILAFYIRDIDTISGTTTYTKLEDIQ